MSLELRDRSAASRCPYCFDQLELPELDQVECGGCGTQHHQICLEELGGCTVQGCPEAGSGPPRATGTVEELRERIRERARRFAKNRVRYGHGQPPQLGPNYDPGQRKDLLLTIQEVWTAYPSCPIFLTVGFCLVMVAIVVWAALTGA